MNFTRIGDTKAKTFLFFMGLIFLSSHIVSAGTPRPIRHLPPAPSRSFVPGDQSFPIQTLATTIADPNAADLAPVDPDILLSQEISDLAAALNNSPRDIFEFVRDQCDYEVYSLSMKGSRGVLIDRGGNDVDLASFLMALLRVAGYPCRYTYGTIQVPIDKARAWVGVNDADDIVTLFDNCRVDASLITVDGNTYLELPHVWVVAFIPYADYRGFPFRSQGNDWIHLDPSFKTYSYSSGPDISEEFPFTTALRDDYLSQVHTETPLDYYYSYLRANNVDVDAIRRQRIAPEVNQGGIVPCNPPYLIKQIYTPVPALSAGYRTKVELKVFNLSTVPTYTLYLPQIYGKRLSLTFEPATSSDQTIIDYYGHLFRTPPDQIYLKPTVRLDGDTITPSGIPPSCHPATELDLRVSVTIPTFSLPLAQPSLLLISDHAVYAGEITAVVVDPPGNCGGYVSQRVDALETVIAGQTDPFFTDEVIGEKLHITGMQYFNRYESDGIDLGEVVHAPYKKLISQGVVGQRLRVRANDNGEAIGLKPVGQYFDITQDLFEFFPLSGGLSWSGLLFTLDRMQGSFHEHAVLDTWFNNQAVSTVKYFQAIDNQSHPYYEVSSTQQFDAVWDSIVFPAELEYSEKENLKITLRTYCIQGHTVRLPWSYLHMNRWIGYAWIDENFNVAQPGDMAANYALYRFYSVAASGGSTTIEPPDPNENCDDPGVKVTIHPAVDSDVYDASWPILGFTAMVDSTDPPSGETYQWTTDLPYDPLTVFNPGLLVFPSGIVGPHYVSVTVTSEPDGCNTDTDRYDFTTVLGDINDFCPPLPSGKSETKSDDCPIFVALDSTNHLIEDVVIPVDLQLGGLGAMKVFVDIYDRSNDYKTIVRLPVDTVAATAIWPRGSAGPVSGPGLSYLAEIVIERPSGSREMWQKAHDVYLVRLTMKHSEGYEDFIPAGNLASGNSTCFKAVIEPTIEALKGTIIFETFNTSSLPGYCMNDPNHAVVTLDYQFTSSGYDIETKTDGAGREIGQEATSTTKVNQAEITLEARDYGGYGKIRAFFVYSKGGQECCKIQAIYDYNQEFFARIPFDYQPENSIADAWDHDDQNAENQDPYFDGDGYESKLLGSHLGDGLSRFEEYRGFLISGTPTRTNPNERDLFIYDPDGLGIWCYKEASGTIVHRIEETEFVNKETRIINNNSNFVNTFSRGLQKGIWLYTDETVDPNWLYLWGFMAPYGQGHGTPGQVEHLIIYRNRIQLALENNGIGQQYGEILSYQTDHEIYHASDVPDHLPDKTAGCFCVFKDFGSMLHKYQEDYWNQPYWYAYDIPIGNILCSEKCQHHCITYYSINDHP